VLLLIVGLVIKKFFILYTVFYNFIFILSATLHRRGVETSDFAACKATYFKIKLRKLYIFLI